jgi:uncharacterized phiE125 gp8 family phage protein
MKHSIITPPTLEPVSLAEIKARARIDVSDSDGILAGYMLEARQWVETVSGLALMTQTIDAYYDEFEDDCLVLPKAPAQSITSLTYLDTAGATQTLSSVYYVLNKRSRVNEVELAYGYCWPVTIDQDNAITVRYVAGYGSTMSDVPEPVRGAIMLYVRYLHDGEDRDERAALSLLEPYRIHHD